MKRLTFLKINNLLYFVYLSDGQIHWVIQRVAAAGILFSMLTFFSFFFFWLFLIIVVFLFFHIFAGIRTLLDDYIHDLNLFLVSNLFLRLSNVYFIKIIYLTFLC